MSKLFNLCDMLQFTVGCFAIDIELKSIFKLTMTAV